MCILFLADCAVKLITKLFRSLSHNDLCFLYASIRRLFMMISRSEHIGFESASAPYDVKTHHSVAA